MVYFDVILKENMRIAMIGQKGIPTLYGGIERHVEELSLELVKNGHEVLAYARSWYTPTAIKNYHGVQIKHISTVHTKHLDAIVHAFLSTIHALSQKVDVIHYHGVGPSLVSWLPRILSPKTKVIATFHCIDRYHQKWNWIARQMLFLGEKFACIFPHQTIVVSKTIQNYCQNEFYRQTNYIPNGVEKYSSPAGTSLLGEWNLRTQKYFLTVTRLVRHKGVHYLIDAWQIARKQYPNLLNDYKLVIVGDSAFTDNYVNELKEMADGDDSIVFTGWQNGQALAELFNNTAMMIHPSENEGLSLSVLRAMSLGKAVLVSDIPEQKELISDYRFWFNNTNISSLAYKIVEIAQHPEWIAEAGEANKKLANKKYNWADIAEKTVQLYTNSDKKQSLNKLQTADV